MAADLPAVVISPGRPGEGGQGGAGEQAAYGLRQHGWTVEYASLSDPPSRVRRFLGSRIVRVGGSVNRWANSREVRNSITPGWVLAYAMPSFAPRERSGVIALHQATHVPDVVLEQLAAARRRAGG